MFSFEISHSDGAARCGEITTPHGQVRTPAFMPVGTAGAVKAIFPDQIKQAGSDMILVNTYHMMLRPGAEKVAALGGLHKFMRWDKPILTDSGGFQIMSLAKLVKITKQGATFRSHLDGSSHSLTPEQAMEVQALLGSDIQMVLDECLALPADDEKVRRSVDLSLDWAVRSKAAFAGEGGLFGIIQGGLSPTHRTYSAEQTIQIGFDGYAIGGLSVGEPQSARLGTLDLLEPLLPQTQPRYLMGAGRPADLVQAIARGIDMFDCVLPTREARHGRAYTNHGVLNLRNAAHADDPAPLDEKNPCPASSWSRAYLHHLFRTQEPLAMMIVTWNNIAYFQSLMAQSRAAICAHCFDTYQKSVLAIYPPA